METKLKLETHGIKIGLLVSAFLIAYFLLMKVVGLLHILELRLLNFVFVACGVVMAIKSYKDHYGGRINYGEGFALGSLVSAVAVFTFAIFLAVYLNIDHEFLRYVQKNALMGGYLTPVTAAAGVSLEGISSGVIFSLASMQYFKRYQREAHG
jgi:hypothetical protein